MKPNGSHSSTMRCLGCRQSRELRADQAEGLTGSEAPGEVAEQVGPEHSSPRQMSPATPGTHCGEFPGFNLESH